MMYSTILVSTTFTYFTLLIYISPLFFFFFFNDTATTEIYTLSLHDALPICALNRRQWRCLWYWSHRQKPAGRKLSQSRLRSEEHTSELQSLRHLVCRLLLEKKKNKINYTALLH